MVSRLVKLIAPSVVNIATIALYIHSLTIDIWLGEVHILQHKEILTRFGLWHSCWKENNFCTDTAKTIYYDLNSLTGGDTAWLSVVQFLMVAATVLVGYGLLVLMTDIIYEKQNISLRAYFLFFSGFASMILALSYFYHIVKSKFKHNAYEWGYSFIIACLCTIFSFVMNSIFVVYFVPSKRDFCRNCLINPEAETLEDHQVFL